MPFWRCVINASARVRIVVSLSIIAIWLTLAASAQIIDEFKGRAERGDAYAQNNLGWMYLNGQGVAQDYAEAARWYRKAADQGNALGQSRLGEMYEYGRGVPQDYAEAARWYRKAADQGNASGQYSLGMMYENGRGVRQDRPLALYWINEAAEQGVAYASQQAQFIKAAGVVPHTPGTNDTESSVAKPQPQSKPPSIHELRMRTDLGDAIAQCNLGDKYFNGEGVAQDYAEAARWYRKAAEQGNSDGQVRLGAMYQTGRGVAQDYSEAVRWYRKAAEQGNAAGQNILGVMYQYGPAMPQDDAEAVRWYRKAAEQGNVLGQNNLGLMYESGKAVPQDLSLALYWYNKAAEQGNEDAQRATQRLKTAGVAPHSPETTEVESTVDKPKPQIDRRLAFNEIEELLKGSVSPTRVATLVQQYGVSFELNDEVEKRLRGLGADDKLLIAIAKNHR